MKKLRVILSILMLSGQVWAHDGKILSKTRIIDFEGLVDYIQRTETLDGEVYDTTRHTKFDPQRYISLEEVEMYGITYLSDGLQVKGFLLKPLAQGKYPSIIYNRGGSLEHGSLTHHVSSIGLGELARLAKAGFVVAASQYRGNGGSEGQEEYGGSDINDVLNLVPLLATDPKADTSRLGIFGWSRGGMMTFLTLKQNEKTRRYPFKAAVVGCPSTNMLRSIKERPYLDEWWSGFIPDYNTPDKPVVLRRRSATYWVNELPKHIPLLMLQGAADQSVSPEESLRFVSKLQEHGVPYRFIMYENGSHGLSEHRDEVFDQLITWFNRYL